MTLARSEPFATPPASGSRLATSRSLDRLRHSLEHRRMNREDGRPPPDRGVPGASAAREYERRKRARDHQILMHHPFADKDVVAAREGPAHERAFDIGSDGERWVARVLDKRLDPNAIALHDRAVPERRGNIDHIVIAPSGIWVIDAKRYSGRLTLWQPAEGRGMLAIGKRDKTHLVDGLAKQVAIVEAAIATHVPETRVHGALCFVETELPRGRLKFERWHVLDAEQLAKRINITTPELEPQAVHRLADALTRRFPPA
ncbi:MAG: hypothetical protein QOI73_1450 [Solirubrobacteraceae bacterium]|nr:hypothetical protein [Solirubrobacteraceae bacterium]